MSKTENKPKPLSSVASMNKKIVMKLASPEEICATRALFRGSVKKRSTEIKEVSCIASDTTKICKKLEDPEGTFEFFLDVLKENSKEVNKEFQTFHQDVKK